MWILICKDFGRGLVEPIYTLDCLGEPPQERLFLRLSHLVDKIGKPIKFVSSTDQENRNVCEVYVGNKFVSSGIANSIESAKQSAAKIALYNLSAWPIKKTVDEKSLKVEIEDARKKLFEICSTEKLRLQSGSSSLLTTSENPVIPDETVMDEDSLNVELEDVKRKLFEICAMEKKTESSSLQTASEKPLTYEVRPTKMDVDEVSPHVEHEDVKGESFKVCSAEKLRSQTKSSSLPTTSKHLLTDEKTQEKVVFDEDSPHVESFKVCSAEKLPSQTKSSSLPTASKNLLTDEKTQEQIVIDEVSPNVEPEVAKGKLSEIFSTKQLQIQIGSSSSSTTFTNPLTYEMTIKRAVDEDIPKGMSLKLSKICADNKWPKPIFSFKDQPGRKNKRRFVCSTKIEIPTVESTFHMKGDRGFKKKQAENSAAYYMIRALESCRVISNLQIYESKDAEEAVASPVISNLQMYESKDAVEAVASPVILNPQIYESEDAVQAVVSPVICSPQMYESKDAVEAVASPVIRKLQMCESKDAVEAMEKILNYSFTNKNLLREALQYKSSNSLLRQRLIFAGEPALSLVFTKHMYITYPKLEPNELEHLRTANISLDRLSRLVVKQGIYRFLIGNVPEQREKIIKFIELMGKEDDPDPYKLVKSPRLLVDIVYSIAGAVYIDVNLDVKRFWEILRVLFEPIPTLDDMRQQQPDIMLTLFCFGYKHGKRVEFRYRKTGNRSTIGEVYLDDKFIACGYPNKCSNIAKMSAAKAALKTLSETMPVEMVMNDYIEYEDAKEKLIGICKDRKWPNPVFSFQSFSKGYVYTVEVETSTEEGTLRVNGFLRKRKKVAENNAASHMIRTLKSSPLSRIVKQLQLQQLTDEKKDRKVQRSLEKKTRQSLDSEANLHSKKRKLESLDENGNLQSLDENENPQPQNSLDESKNPQLHPKKKRKMQ
ncbi:ribonuclease 3-like protein 3 isoform X2 [Capsella rubella]|uniref:ribonuclease 3-like protein 3 isoform X2 n=1 Tax=Capsella rubella TaxID=81985 RepID=UPI000CD4FA27|nr:ribonuclease 3-like protein 3 isoform X2 [Capsella rubella]